MKIKQKLIEFRRWFYLQLYRLFGILDLNAIEVVRIDTNVNGHWIDVFSIKGWNDDNLLTTINNGHRFHYKLKLEKEVDD